MTDNAKKAVKIGSLCFFAYLAVYMAKNILGAVAPAMMEAGFSDSSIHIAKAVYFYTYAVGQLVNGIIGDRIKAKYMIGVGLAMAGVSNFVFVQLNIAYAGVSNFAFVPSNILNVTLGGMPIIAYAAYACTGFFLAMIYGPMTKVVSENTEMPYTYRVSLGYTISSYFGSPAAGVFAALFAWHTAFSVSSVALVLMAVTVFFAFTVFERKGIVTYGRFNNQKKLSYNKGSIEQLFERHIVKFAFISILTGIVRATIVTNLSEYYATRLSFEKETAPLVFSLSTLALATSSFIVLFIHEKLKHDVDKTLILMFASAAFFFTLTYFITIPYVNVALIILAIMSSNGAAKMLWSRYCPSLRDTGIVSGVTGFLDFLSYIAAGTMDLAIPGIVDSFAWDGVMVICVGLMLIGVAISIPWKKWTEKKTCE